MNKYPKYYLAYDFVQNITTKALDTVNVYHIPDKETHERFKTWIASHHEFFYKEVNLYTTSVKEEIIRSLIFEKQNGKYDDD